jgi:GH15 family glucan-1,4-alpha-glucosidase
VRVGNAAAEQEQLDVYGEVMDAIYEARRHDVGASLPAWELGRHVLGLLEERWHEPDEGIWEAGGRRHFTHSKVMAWVAFDRGIKLCEEFGLDGPLERWRAIRSEIHAEVRRESWNDELGSFTQSYGSPELDASLLLLPQVGFLPPDDPRIRGTLAAVQGQLSSDGFLLRYRSGQEGDGLPAGEGTFLPCSFWLVDALALDGRHDEAVALFERLQSVRNDVGLLAEEYDPQTGRAGRSRLIRSNPIPPGSCSSTRSSRFDASTPSSIRVSSSSLVGPRRRKHSSAKTTAASALLTTRSNRLRIAFTSRPGADVSGAVTST